jgi:hypothetical protein
MKQNESKYQSYESMELSNQGRICIEASLGQCLGLNFENKKFSSTLLSWARKK